jgi:ATP-binding cassette subfamily F protein 3
VRDQEEQAAAAGGAKPASTPGNAAKAVAASATTASAEANGNGAAEAEAKGERVRKLNPIKLKQMEERCTFLEEEVPRIEAAIALTEEQLGAYVSAEETQRQSALLENLREQLSAFTAEWEDLMMQLEEQSAHS